MKIGDPTFYFDRNGIEICIGDIIESIYNNNHRFKTLYRPDISKVIFEDCNSRRLLSFIKENYQIISSVHDFKNTFIFEEI